MVMPNEDDSTESFAVIVRFFTVSNPGKALIKIIIIIYIKALLDPKSILLQLIITYELGFLMISYVPKFQ